MEVKAIANFLRGVKQRFHFLKPGAVCSKVAQFEIFGHESSQSGTRSA
jgi:hypothetical protein